ncbi:hypothetical protein AJ78_05041 [Emergomyces pasteurianus Ep9510]|uniref:Uncharacterized protein n=1 Tax=Emergomyces pasteurianus Ep9510 TaxID=1447872 RepID=A0A1J9QFC9_9EURO|nr:hypothetical protein AJ78_05041 [Emergomyces pasteurianus Ep9510]
MPPLKNILKNPTQPDKLDKPDKRVQPRTTTSKTINRRTIRSEARRTLPLNKSGANRQRQRRLALGGNTRSQKTLTQIDFVKRAQAFLAGDDEDEDDAPDLGYIGEEKWDGDGDVPVRSSKRRKRDGNGKGRSTPNEGGSRIARGGRAHGMDGEDDDKTLTQMGYVIKPSSWYHSGRTKQPNTELDNGRSGARLETIGEEPEAEMGDTLQETPIHCDNQVARRSRKRKPPEGNAECHPLQSEICSSIQCGGEMLAAAPVTPRKPIRLAIPSSQSPDSPDLMPFPWSLKQSPVRFPLAPVSENLASKNSLSPVLKNEHKTPVLVSQVAQYEIPESSFNSSGTGSPARSCANESAVGLEITPSTSPPLLEGDSNKTLSTSSHSLPKQVGHEAQEAKSVDYGTIVHGATKFNKSVIYETDAESEDEEFHDPRSINDDGDDNLNELPVQRRTSDQETCDDLPGTTLGSEPSMLYYRKPMSLAFDPSSELDNIGTQKLAELFPDLEAETLECEIPPLSAPHKEHEAEQDKADDAPTRRPGEASYMDFVPDSSPRRQSDTAPEHITSPLLSASVVLVASSQQSDMKNAEPECTDHIDSQSDCQGLVTTSQLLTDSMMESVPGPPMWMSSQYLSQEEEELREEGG